jgi:protein ImuB
MVVCILLPRFELAVAAGGREALAAGPLALAPEIGREPLIGETSAAAEAYGVRPGLRLGEALARCPTLRLVAPDPAGVADAWEHLVAALEGVGAAVESSDRPGAAWFEEQGLRRLHGGSVEGVVTAARRALAAARVGNQGGGSPPVATPSPFPGGGATARLAAAAPSSVPPPAGVVAPLPTAAASSGAGRIGVAPSRFAALAAAHRARARRSEIAPESPKSLAAYLAPLPVSLLGMRPEVAALPEALERFGIATLGDLAALSRAQLADRFGPAGPLARDLARGRDLPLRPRVPSERLEEVLELPESASGPQLERALGMLIDRVLARNERRGRTVRAVVLSAKLVGGGTWRTQMTFREALADPRRMRLAITGRLTELPAPADSLRLRVEAFGPPSGDQRSLLAEAAAVRRARLREAVRQTRAAAGPDAALRILAVDPDSRVPERRLALAPWEP